MSVINCNGVGNIIITYKFKTDTLVNQIDEESRLKSDLAQFLRDKQYKFLLADDEVIDERVKADKELMEK